MTLRPLRDEVLVQLEKEEKQTDSGLVLPSSSGPSNGKVVALGPKVMESTSAGSVALKVGDRVLVDDGPKPLATLPNDQQLVPSRSILAVLPDDVEPRGPSFPRFFHLPDWEDFVGANFAAWKDYSNIRSFSFDVEFLEPFRRLGDLAPLLLDVAVKELAPDPDFRLQYLTFGTEQEDDNKLLQYNVRSIHDILHGKLYLSELANRIGFMKLNSDLASFHRTVPLWMSALASVADSPVFRDLVGPDYSRVSRSTMVVKQQVLIQGKGLELESLRNSDLMQQFLRLEDGSTPATLGVLGIDPESVLRADLKLAFSREVRDHKFQIFLDIAAPSNEEFSIMEIEWELQDLSVGELPEREYGGVFVDFMRDRIFKSFYKTWFHNVACVTARR